jgi:hypothetical protein
MRPLRRRLRAGLRMGSLAPEDAQYRSRAVDLRPDRRAARAADESALFLAPRRAASEDQYAFMALGLVGFRRARRRAGLLTAALPRIRNPRRLPLTKRMGTRLRQRAPPT